MDVKKFKSGKFRTQNEYDSFSPSPIRKPWAINNPALIMLHSEADRKLGELNAAGRWIPHIDYFISMHIAKEATTSSKIEGTRTTIEEAIAHEEDIDPERRDDWTEVTNYIRAMNNAIERMQELPLSTRLLRETHEILLSGVRGKHKSPGEFRQSQNWIGLSLKTAQFIPPAHDEVPELMSDLEKFLNDSDDNVPPLLKVALAHYQFETIHPFLDGNGRLGRLLITLYLVSAKILDKPTLYLSDFFERNRREYYDGLTRAREKNDLENWLKLFFTGVIETASNSIRTLEKVQTLRLEMENERIPMLGKRAPKGIELLQKLYTRPVVDRVDVEKMIGISTSAAGRMIAELVSLGILEEITGMTRNRRYAFREYIAIFER